MELVTINNEEFDELSKECSDENFQNFVINHLLDKWIDQYAEKKFLATTFQSPKITSSISETPGTPSNQFRSITEVAAIKSADAKRFIEIFEDKLQQLPTDYKRIIEIKYLQVGLDQNYLSDELVYPELHIPRKTYFKKKKKALFTLGLLLLEVPC